MRRPADRPGPTPTMVLWFVRDFTRYNGYAPSVREVAEDFGIATSWAQSMLLTLERDGRIRRDRRVARSIVVVA